MVNPYSNKRTLDSQKDDIYLVERGKKVRSEKEEGVYVFNKSEAMVARQPCQSP